MHHCELHQKLSIHNTVQVQVIRAHWLWQMRLGSAPLLLVSLCQEKVFSEDLRIEQIMRKMHYCGLHQKSKIQNTVQVQGLRARSLPLTRLSLSAATACLARFFTILRICSRTTA